MQINEHNMYDVDFLSLFEISKGWLVNPTDAPWILK